jgi:hypothetical protein
MSRRSMLLLPAVIAALAMPAASALAGEEDGGGSGSPSLDQPRNCVSERSAKVTVSGDDIATVAFYVDGKRMKRVAQPAVTGRFVFAMRCSSLSAGAHRGRAVVTDTSGGNSTLRFTIARAAQASPRFTG